MRITTALVLFSASLVAGGWLAVSLATQGRGQGGGQQGFTWTLHSGNRQNPVEQQSANGSLTDCAFEHCVVNPSMEGQPYPYGLQVRFWDADDNSQLSGAGLLAPGASTSLQFLLYADGTAHLAGLKMFVEDSNPNVQMQIRVQRDGVDLMPPLTQSAFDKGVYSMCALGPDYWEQFWSTNLEEVPNSGVNGPNGVAAKVDVLMSITNTGSRTLRRTSASAAIKLNVGEEYCPHGWPVTTYGQGLITPAYGIWWDKE
jgi:hypothetical protein